MKRYLILISSFLIIASFFTSCGYDSKDNAHSDSEYSSELLSENIIDETSLEDSSHESMTDEKSYKKQAYSKKFNDKARPAAVGAKISAICEKNLKSVVRIKNLYGENYLHTAVVGLVGVPVEVSYPKDILSDTKLTFYYDKNELCGVPEKNLIVLHYIEEEQYYDEISAFSLDSEASTVSLQIFEPGVYLLTDAYQWFKTWGDDRYRKYAYEIDKSAYKSDWERECDTGSIMDIADVKWAMDNAPHFSVSTPEQLAGVVYYVNGINNEDEVTITLENDIDLKNYEWVPMGWYNGVSHSFSGEFNGQGHSVFNMKISSNYDDSGFIGYGLNTKVSDVTFVNAEVKGRSCTGIVGGQIYITSYWENIKLIDCKVKGPETDSGSIIGREAGTAFKNCSVENVRVNDELFEYFSFREKKVAETEVVESFTISMDDNYIIRRDEHEGFRNLCWHLEKDGIQQLDRNAMNELEYNANNFLSQPGHHIVYLTAFIDGTYIRVSNIIEFDN